MRTGTKGYYKACAEYAKESLLYYINNKEKTPNQAVALMDVLDALDDIIYDYNEMKETIEDYKNENI